MKREILASAAMATCIYFFSSGTGVPPALGQKSLPPSTGTSQIFQGRSDFGKIPMYFVPNQGQLDERVAYYVQGKDKTIFFGAEGVTFAINKANRTGLPTSLEPGESPRWTVKMDFLNANPGVKPMGVNETGAVVSYFNGKFGDSTTGLRPFSRIVYTNLWPGIDLVYFGTKDALKYEFVVKPGADPSRICLAYRGASHVGIGEKGNLVVSTPMGGFEDGAPVAYQERTGGKVDVPLAYKILDDKNRGASDEAGAGFVFGFSIGEYDRSEPLVLDPVILIYCGYLGGTGFDYSYGIAVDREGCAYVVGYTYSLGAFPVVVGPDLSWNGGGVDAFVAKLNPRGTALDYCGYIGGAGNDYGYAIAVDALGCAFITGYTSSTEATFPVKKGPDLTHNGGLDVFVAKVNSLGTALEYCGYIGGMAQDYGKGIAVDSSGRAYITGSTSSLETSFPVKIGPTLIQNGDQDAFVARVNALGTALDYCGYIGGSGADAGTGIAVDGLGHAFLTGKTNSTTSDASPFPVLIGPDVTQRGNFDAFVAEVNVDGLELIYCGYIGGSGDDYGNGIALDPQGNAYIVGYTSSSESSFPVLVGPDLSHNGGYYDAFIVKVKAGGASHEYGGFIGGADNDIGAGIAVDGRGYASITGYTSSREDTFPVRFGPGLTHSGSFDAFVAKVDATGKELGYCGYIGGFQADYGTAVALGTTGSGNVYLTGTTYSTESTFPVTVGPDLVYNGSRDGFAAEINDNSITLTAPNGGEYWHVGFQENITWHSDGIVGNVRIEYSTDRGETWALIADATENDGLYTWIVPDSVSTTCLVRVSEAVDGDPIEVSRAVFTITNAPILVISAPNGGENWPVGSTQTITWKWGGDVGDVAIEYTIDNGLTWIEIIASTENDGSYTWIVPDTVSAECRVGIREAADSSPADVSNGVFSIVGGTLSRAKNLSIPKVIKTIKDKMAGTKGDLP